MVPVQAVVVGVVVDFRDRIEQIRLAIGVRALLAHLRKVIGIRPAALGSAGDPGEENWAGLGAEILTLGWQDVIGGVVFSEDPRQALAELSEN